MVRQKETEKQGREMDAEEEREIRKTQKQISRPLEEKQESNEEKLEKV